MEEYQELVDKIITHPDIDYLTSDELEMYAESILKILFSKVRAKMTEKQDLAIMLEKMSNEEFEEYLKNKYGPRWMLVTLLPEELDRCPPILEEDIEAALKQGEEDARRAEANYPQKW